MRRFVTGAGGHLGRTVCAHALAAGHEVAGSVRRAAAPGRVRPFPLDVRDLDAVAVAVRASGAEAVVHMAAVQAGDGHAPGGLRLSGCGATTQTQTPETRASGGSS